jgi:hypothetical protein
MAPSLVVWSKARGLGNTKTPLLILLLGSVWIPTYTLYFLDLDPVVKMHYNFGKTRINPCAPFHKFFSLWRRCFFKRLNCWKIKQNFFFVLNTFWGDFFSSFFPFKTNKQTNKQKLKTVSQYFSKVGHFEPWNLDEDPNFFGKKRDSISYRNEYVFATLLVATVIIWSLCEHLPYIVPWNVLRIRIL